MAARRSVSLPAPHPSGARPPLLPSELVPKHVAIVMDGNGRWARSRGLPRTAGHERGEAALLDVVEGAIEVGAGNVLAGLVRRIAPALLVAPAGDPAAIAALAGGGAAIEQQHA